MIATYPAGCVKVFIGVAMSFFSIDKKIRCIVWCVFVSGALLFPQAAGSGTVGSAQNETLITQGVPPVILSFKYKKGDSYRTLSKVHEDVFVNSKKNHHAEIVTRISAKIVDVHTDGSGVCEATFMSSEDSTSSANGAHFSWGDEYKSVFTRSARGIYAIADIYFMPVVRDCPIFPETPVKPGDTWSAEGHEAHDLRRTFALQKPFTVPFTASYGYKGIVKNSDGRIFNVIDVQYNLYFESPKINVRQGDVSARTAELLNRPKITMGHSHQTLYWDNERGEIDHYHENFKIVIETYYGDTFTFQGTAEAEVTEFERVNDDSTVQKIQDSVAELGLEDVSVKKGKKGLTISLEKIQFLPDSAVLRESEKRKLEKIADILKAYKNDLLVTGHTALRGTEKARQILSEERAQSVADYLVALGVRDSYHVFTQGKGAAEPIATNQTEEGRSRNRRVEITIMDE